MFENLHLKVSRARLKFGDVSFEGNGPEGRVVTVGIEVKRVPDLLQSLKDGRLVGTQLPGLQRSYELPWLMVHGSARPGRDGLLEVYHPRWKWVKPHANVMFKDVQKFLWTMRFKYGVDWRWYPSTEDMVVGIQSLYEWWTGKEWEEHASGQAFDFSTEKTFLYQPSFTRSVAKELPGIGWKRSRDVVHRFRTVESMVLASESEWRSVPGVGKVNARRIYKAIHEG
jgi:ERCC4-type nuclease